MVLDNYTFGFKMFYVTKISDTENRANYNK